MKTAMKIAPWLLLAAVAGCASKSPAPASGLERSSMDQSVRPQDDLYLYMNGAWLERTEIPADRPQYASFYALADTVEGKLRGLVEESAAKPNKAAGSDEQKIGDLYASFMNEARIERLGAAPLAPEFARVDGIREAGALAAQFAHFSRIGVPAPLGYGVGQDDKLATQYIASVNQPGGLGLPDRDYYLLDDARFTELRAAYLAHVERMLELVGVKDAAVVARDILGLETRIARIMWTRVDLRDSEKTYHKFAFAELPKVAPGFDWSAYLREVGAEKSPGLIVGQPNYVRKLAGLMRSEKLTTWRAYLKLQLLRATAPLLSQAFVDEHFNFNGRVLRGTQENRARWKRGVGTVQSAMGEVLGKLYVAKYFPPEAKQRMQAMVENLTAAYADSIQQLDWMSAETKARALDKLAKFTPKIGYPDQWKDYSALTIAADDLFGNRMRAAEVAFQRDRAKLGAPIDRFEWAMTPQTVDAYYSGSLNQIVFPAAILQPPFFDLAADDAANYGGIGSVIGHEIGHGFDDQGSKYDGEGNLQSWWTEADRKAFEARTQQLIAQYDGYCPQPGVCVNGALTVGENIGDLGGLSVAYQAYRRSLGRREPPVIDGFTGDQRFFLGWAQVWASKYRDQELVAHLKTNPHAPGQYRTNGAAANVPAFYTAFEVKPGDKMYLPPERRVKIW